MSKSYVYIFFIIIFLSISYLIYNRNLNQAPNMNSNSDLIPRKIFASNLELNKQSPRVSPNGENITYIAPHNGVLNIWIASAKEPSKSRVLTNDTKRGIRQHFWSFTNDDIFYLKDEDGDENSRLYVLNLTTGKELLLTPAKSVLATIIKISPDHPSEILVGLNDRNPAYHDIHKINIKTGQSQLIYQNEEFSGFVYDDEFNIIFACKPASDGGKEYLYNLNGKFIPYQKIDYENSMSTSIIGINRAKTHMFMTDSRQGNFSCLRSIKLSDIEELGEKALGDIIFSANEEITDIFLSSKSREVIAVATTYFRSKWHVINADSLVSFEKINSHFNGDYSIISESLDDKIWIIALNKDTQPYSYYLYNRDDNKLNYLFSNSEELDRYNKDFVPMHYVDIIARDGLKIPSYYSLPKGCEISDESKATKSVPFILLVHGGPQVRDDWGFNKLVQFLANRGYGVLQMNYRGSDGFGKNLMNQGAGEWGAKAHDDLIDGVNWLVNNKFTEKNTVAILGGSYGGYAALAGLTFTPDVFACAIDIVGPSNLETLIQSIPEYWKPHITSMTKRIGGDPKTPEGVKFLRSRSPLFFVDQIKKPLLILHGQNDPRVKLAESDQIVDLMTKKNIPVTYGVFPNEGHGFARPENNLASYAIIENFLAKFLGGRAEPINNELKESSIIIKQDATELNTYK